MINCPRSELGCTSILGNGGGGWEGLLMTHIQRQSVTDLWSSVHGLITAFPNRAWKHSLCPRATTSQELCKGLKALPTTGIYDACEHISPRIHLSGGLAGIWLWEGLHKHNKLCFRLAKKVIQALSQLHQTGDISFVWHGFHELHLKALIIKAPVNRISDQDLNSCMGLRTITQRVD